MDGGEPSVHRQACRPNKTTERRRQRQGTQPSTKRSIDLPFRTHMNARPSDHRLPWFIPSFMHSFLPSFLHACMHARRIPTDIHARPSDHRLSWFMHACMHACMHARRIRTHLHFRLVLQQRPCEEEDEEAAHDPEGHGGVEGALRGVGCFRVDERRKEGRKEGRWAVFSEPAAKRTNTRTVIKIKTPSRERVSKPACMSEGGS